MKPKACHLVCSPISSWPAALSTRRAGRTRRALFKDTHAGVGTLLRRSLFVPYLWTSPRCSLLLLTRCSPSFSMKSLEFTRNRAMKDRRFTHRRWALAPCLCSGFGTSVISLVISFHTPVALSGFGTSPSTRQTSARAAVHGVSHRRLCRPRIRPCDTIEAKTSC